MTNRAGLVSDVQFWAKAGEKVNAGNVDLVRMRIIDSEVKSMVVATLQFAVTVGATFLSAGRLSGVSSICPHGLICVDSKS